MLLNLSDMKSVFGMSVVCVVELVYVEALTPYVLDHSMNPAKFSPIKHASEAAMDFLVYHQGIDDDIDENLILSKDELLRWVHFWRFFHEDVVELKKENLVSMKVFDSTGKPHGVAFANYEKRQSVVNAANSIIAMPGEDVRFKNGNLNAIKIVKVMERETKTYWPKLEEPVFATKKLEEIVSNLIKNLPKELD